MENTKKTMEKIVALCKGRGFVYPGSEIYGGLANTWDYGPLGMALKNNIKQAWLKKFVQENKYNVGLDSAILMNPQTWVASGHLGGFSDPLMDCKECKTRHRADNLIEDFDGTNVAGWSNEQMTDYIKEKEIGRHRGQQERAVSAPRNRAGHFCQLCQHPAHHPQKDSLRRSAGGQVLPQRDHPRQLHFPRARV